MTKKEYLDRLAKELGTLSYNDVQDILSDIDGHFANGIQAGKTEDEIASALGDPSDLAKDYKDGMTFPMILKKMEKKEQKPKAHEPTSQTVMFVLLITVFIGIPSFVTLFAIVLGIILAEIAAAVGAVALLCTCWSYGAFLASGLLAGLALLFFAIFGYAVTYFSVKYFVLGTKWYISSMKHVWHNGI